MRTALIACAIAIGSATPLGVSAQTTPPPAAAPAPAPEFTITGNAGLFSDYRYRGYSQTDYKPAFQGGIDFAHKSGFYLGNWNSNVSSVLFNGASLEMDFYGGYKWTVGDFGFDVGGIYYYYPGTGKYVSGYEPDFFEGYIGGTWGPLSLKYFYAFTNYFDLKAPGVDTKGSQYLDFSVAYPFDGGWAVQAHAGWQKINNGQQVGLIDDTYFDYKLGVTYDIAGSGWLAGLAVVGTNEKKLFLKSDLSDGAGKTSVVVSVTKTF